MVLAGVVAIAAVIGAILLARHGGNRWAVPLGLILIELGVVAFLIRKPYGWFAYTPGSSDEQPVPDRPT